MIRKFKRWWQNHIALPVLSFQFRSLALLTYAQEAFAPAARKTLYREMRAGFEKFAEHYRALNKINAVSPQKANQMNNAFMEKFYQEYGAKEEFEKARNSRLEREKLQEEFEQIRKIRDDAGEDFEKSIAVLREYYLSHPASLLACTSLAFVLNKSGAKEEAVSLFQEFLSRADKLPYGPAQVFMTTFLLAGTLYEQGEVRETVFLLEKLMAEERYQKTPIAAAIYMLLGDAYQKSNNPTEARNAWKCAIAAPNGDILSTRIKERLQQL